MNFNQPILHYMDLPFSWNDIFNWSFVITSTLGLFIAVILQIVQSIQNRKKTINSTDKTAAAYQGARLTEKSKKTNK